ncbi:hypothetical protein OJ997_19250 [Solirubrobacter phytolaccae]|uniref:Uncharacterized protein n=1 Tax=Solirubrobacter phytolaccae TaxID=1404360 RepID=A0A9X3NCA2_9ACTN|nr:hypothetical protein [Solirubrobacter phytolaccae]MDA0182454.1 hypothetical protein [Solirubrobacter phytolaccae]
MRLPVALFVALLALPASAQAGVVGLEGTQLVLRADPGEQVRVGILQPSGGQIRFTGTPRVGAGCVAADGEVACPETGVTGVVVQTGDGDDRVSSFINVPLTLTLGGGDDVFFAQASAATVDAGPGNDRGYSQARSANVVGGAGDDRLELETNGLGPLRLDGGAGDDTLRVISPGISWPYPRDERNGAPRPRIARVAITCGPGADHWIARPHDKPGDGCAPRVTGITPDTVSRAFREGRLTGPASGTVTLRRRVFQDDRPRQRVAHGSFNARRGPLRVPLERTKAARRRQPVAVKIGLRAGAERGEITFLSRLG